MIILDKKYPADLASIRTIHADLKTCLKRLNYDNDAISPFMLSASEILTNTLKHSSSKPEIFKITLKTQRAALDFILLDDGDPFDNFEVMHNCSKAKSADMKEGILETGGIGLFLAGRDFNNFTYERMRDWNCYRLSAPSPFLSQKPLALIVDDDPIQLCLLDVYTKEFYQIQKAKSGHDALAWLKDSHKKPDIILCDVMMEDGDGIELCNNLQNDKTLALIPFIFMTGNIKNTAAQIAENLPVNGFLQKPVCKDSLLKTLKRTLGKAQQDRQLLGDRLDDEITSVLAPSLPEKIDCYQISLKWQAAEAGGGDIALHLQGNECDHIIVMDIMGHGAQAKFFSHSFAGYLHGFFSAQSNVQDPADILTALSHFLHTDKIGEKTILTAQILTTLRNGTIKIASAGHPAPLLCDGENVHEVNIEGAMPGLCPNTIYESVSLSLESGQRLIMYTDGLMEVGKNAEAMEAHESNIRETIKSTWPLSTAESTAQTWNVFLEKTAVSLNDDAILIIIQRD